MINLQGLRIDNWIPPLDCVLPYQLSDSRAFLERSLYFTTGVKFVKGSDLFQQNLTSLSFTIRIMIDIINLRLEEKLIMNDKKTLSGPGTVVGVNVKLVGTLNDANEIIVHGKIEGEVISEKNVNISETAYVKGPVSAEVVQIAGEVHGSVVATGKLEILPTGKVFGSITTKDLNIRSGAIFVGKSNMPEGDKEVVLPEEGVNLDEKDKKDKPEKTTGYEVE